MRGRHHDARNGDSADKIKSVHVVVVRQRRAFNLHQHVDRHTFRRRRQIGQLQQQPGAVFNRFAKPDNPAGAHFNPGIAHLVEGVQALLVGTGGDDIAVEFRRGIKVVVVIIQTGAGQALRLAIVERTEGHAGFQPQRFHPFHHLLKIRHIAVVRVLPRRAHAEAG